MKTKTKLIPIVMGLLTVSLIIVSSMLIKTQNVYAEKSQKYKELDTLTQAMYLIQRDYVESVDNQTMVYGAIKGMLDELDPYSTFFDPDALKDFRDETQGEFGGLGIHIGIREKILTVISPIEDTPAFRKGLQAGDQIIKIEGKSTAGITIEEAVKKLKGEPKTDVTITLHRDSVEKPFDVTITRDIIKIISVKSAAIGNVGYIRINQFTHNVSKDIAEAVKTLNSKGVKGFIVDVRNNPGGLLPEAIGVSSIFLPANQLVVFTKDRASKREDYKSVLFSTKELEKPIIVLTNGGSASASEILTGALQDHGRAVIMGTKTFGKASVQTIMQLVDGSGIKLTTAKYFTPNERSIHEKGIEPDIKIEANELTDEEIEALMTKRIKNSKEAYIELDKDNQLVAAVDKMKELIKNAK